MTTFAQLADPASTLFPDLDLGDERLDRRFAAVVRAIAANPGASLPRVFPDPSQYHAALNLFDSPLCTHENILGAHQEAALNAMEARTGPVLLLHDTTTLDFSGHTTLAGDLGPIAKGAGGSGWLAHHTLAVDPGDRTVLGLVSQILHVREPAPKGEKAAARRQREGRESRLWVRGIDEVGPAARGCYWVDVADRGSDAFEFLQQLRDRGRHFVIRSKHNRALGCGPSDRRAAELLHDRMRTLPATSHWELEIPARAGVSGRTAKLCGVAEAVVLRPPAVKKGDYRAEPIRLTAVRVWEPSPPAGVVGMEWQLLSSEEADAPGAVERSARWYSCRMQVEEFHKVQKSGAGVESPQVQSVEKLAAIVAVLSVIAVGMMNLRLAAREPASAGRPAAEVVPEIWVEALSYYLTGGLCVWTVAQFWLRLARLGGHLKDPKKHPPGWMTLWRGWCQLRIIVRCYLSMAKIR